MNQNVVDPLFHIDSLNGRTRAGRIDGAVEHVKLLDEQYLLVASAGTFPDGPVRVKLLNKAPLIAWPPTYHQKWLERELASAGARPRIVFRTTGHETIVSMVRTGIGSAVLPWLALHGSDAWSDDRLSIHHLRPSPTRTILLHWRAGRTHSPLATRAIELAVNAANDLAKHI